MRCSSSDFAPTTDFGLSKLNISQQCAASLAASNQIATWTMRASFPEYVIALSTIVGSVLFSVSSVFETSRVRKVSG